MKGLLTLEMQDYSKYFLLILVLGITGCDESGKLDEFFRPAPVQPLAEIITTSVPIGHCAMVAMANQNGFQIPYESIQRGDGVSLIRIIPTNEFPLIYLEPSCREILILSFPAGDDFAIMSMFFVRERIIEWHTIPVILDDGKIKAVFASQDICVRDSVEVDLHMGPADIRIELERVEKPVPESAGAAIEQNAWIIDVDPSGTWDLFADDTYTITGGAQDVSVYTGPSGNESSVLQLAMIDTRIYPDCIISPSDGFAVLHEIDLNTGPEESIEDLVLGTVFYHFRESCTGMVDIPLATGNYIGSTGKKIDLKLLD